MSYNPELAKNACTVANSIMDLLKDLPVESEDYKFIKGILVKAIYAKEPRPQNHQNNGGYKNRR